MSRKASAITPAAYPPTDHSESRAIDCLNDLLCDSSIKSHIHKRDKIPNIDGFVELVDEWSIPIGKLEVQVKYLNKADRRRMGYSCELSFLSYCTRAPLPVLLIGVAPEERKAFWLEITRAYAQKAIAAAKGKGKITVRFSQKHVIDGVTHRHVKAWHSIAAAHQNKIETYDEIAPQAARLRALAASVEQPGLGFPDPQNIDFEKIQIHLDELNSLLETSFPIVRATLFPGAWKIGLAFADYEDHSLAYCYYPVRKGQNDLLIRRVPPKTFRGLDLSKTIHFHDNPLMEDPAGLAREFAQEQAVKLLDAMAFRFDDMVLCRETLFTVVDKLNTQLGLTIPARFLSLEEFGFAWSTYLPNWLHYIWKTIPRKKLKGLLEVAQWHGYIDLDALEFLVYSLEGRNHSAISSAVHKQVAQNPTIQLPFRIGLRSLSLSHVERLTDSLAQRGIARIERLYTRFDFHRRPRSGLISDWWTHAQFQRNLKRYYQELPRLFDHVVEMNFPGLRDHLKYFNDFDRRIVVIDANDSTGFHFNYCDLRGGNSNEIQVLSHRDGFALPQPEQKWMKIEGIRYEVRRIGSSRAMFMFHPLPLLTGIRDELKSRLKRLPVLGRAPRKPSSNTQFGPDGIISITLH